MKEIKTFGGFRRWIVREFKEKLSKDMIEMLKEVDYEGPELTWAYNCWFEYNCLKGEGCVDEVIRAVVNDEIMGLPAWARREEVYIGIWRNKKQGGVVAAFELKEGILVSHKTGIHATVSKDWFYSNFKKEASL